MIRTAVITWAAMLTFAAYNALSIKGLTNTWYWHIAQYAAVVLFIFSGIEQQLKKYWQYWRQGDFHNFGGIYRFILVLIIAVGLYVESLHWLLPIVEKWK